MFSSSSINYSSSSRQQPPLKRKEHPYDDHPYQTHHRHHPEQHYQNYPPRYPLQPLQEPPHQHHSHHKSMSTSLPSLPTLSYTPRSSRHVAHPPTRQRLHSNASISSSASWNSCPQLISSSSSYASSVASSTTPSASNSPQLHHRDDNLLLQHQHPYRHQQQQNYKRIKGDRQDCPKEVKEETESFRLKHVQEHRPPLPLSYPSRNNSNNNNNVPQLPMMRQSSIPRVSRPQVPVMTKKLARLRAMRRPTRSTFASCTLSDLVYAIELDAALSREAASVLTGVLVNAVPDKSRDEGRVHPVQQQRRQQDLWARLECERTKVALSNNNKTADLHARWIQNHMERAKKCCSSSSSLLSRPHSQRMVHSHA